MADLSNRSLLDTRRDVALFVDRERELEALRDSVKRRFNTLVLGPPGSGKSSLLMRLVYELRQEQKTPLLVIDGAVASDAVGFLTLLRNRLVHEYGGSEVERLTAELAAAQESARAESEAGENLTEQYGRVGRFRDVGPAGSDRSSAGTETMVELVYELQRRAREFKLTPVVVVDGVASAEVAHDLFGRLRDELWRLGFVWLVAADSSLRPAFQEPPADAFFDVTIELGPLPDGRASELLSVRDRENELRDDVREAIVQAAKGSPRRLLGLARQALAGKSAEAILREAQLVERVGDEVGESAKRLVDELMIVGGASASDEELLRRLGWSRMRAQQVLAQLEDAGFVEVVGQRNGARGRPRKVYGLKSEAAQ